MKLALIAAMTDQRVIGRDNGLPWHLSSDLKRFKRITMGHAILMGRRTYESIGKPLPGRRNIVLSRDERFCPEGVEVVRTFEEALARGGEPLFVIGGEALFKLALPLADTLYLTILHEEIPGDTYFPPFTLEPRFEIVEEEKGEENDLSYTFLVARKR